ncbi:MAG: cysteine--tRNA ligase [Elusimicrobia bacterium RIFCSPLOWO2_01_FULL_64_13]|nr:MAG: cysteine--tRNA ligase [Elusimicrobia bacterium RIFCSPLOWO2_01_FULL_64_13]
MDPRGITVHNTLSGRKEPFRALEPDKVKLYVCGITPYGESHLGHARCYVFFDTVKRFFKSQGFQVEHVQNFTDIDDKIIDKAAKSGEAPTAVAERFIRDYFDKMSRLNIERADRYPRVTDVLPDIVRFIEGLIGKGLAYPLEGDVYYSVRGFAGYGKLSKRSLDEMEAGARVEVNERKKDPLDFALWKAAKAGEPAWDSPWGPGRPGWHIECSAMSMKFLGETFDVHGGGQDLIFPHHENEIAQSEGLTGKPFVRAWLHNGFVTVNREKMSKSLGNFFTLGEIFGRCPPPVVRFFLLSRHYRTPLDFSDDLLRQAQSAYQTLRETCGIADFLAADAPVPAGPVAPGDPGEMNPWEEEFLECLADDFNTEKAIAALFRFRSEMLRKIQDRDLPWLGRARRVMRRLCEEVLGVLLGPEPGAPLVRELRDNLARREAARKAKDWRTADRMRDEVLARGFVIEDTSAGPLIKPAPESGL